jgi:Tol biopolymer transport system component
VHRISAAILVAACACGRHGFEARLAPDAANPDAPPDSAPDAHVPCTGMPFGTPALLSSIATGSQESDPALTSDGMTVFFTSNRSGGMGYAIWTATRPSLAAPFGPATVVAELDSAARESDASISRNGRELFFMSDRSGPTAIYVATRSSSAGPFDPPALLVITGAPNTVRSGPEITADGLGLYYADDLDIAYASRSIASGPFTFQRVLTELNVPQTDGNPTVSTDELEIWFDSYRTGPGRTYRAARTIKTAPFSAPVIATDVDTGFAATGTPTLSADDTTLYFYADATGQLDIYAATRSCP